MTELSDLPSVQPSTLPSDLPSKVPSDLPTDAPTEEPTEAPTDAPTEAPTEESTEALTDAPTTEEPTEAPTDALTEAPTEAPTDAPIYAPTDSFTLSPIASTSSAVSGMAAPGSPVLTRERKLSEDILTVAEFERTLKEETDIILGVSSGDSNCVVETSAIQYDASDSVCTEFFTAAQLVGVSFCYSFQITISAPTSGGGCEVNTGAQLVTETLEENGSANAIGPVEDMEIAQLATTNAPTTGPTFITDAPTTEGPTFITPPSTSPKKYSKKSSKKSSKNSSKKVPIASPTAGPIALPTAGPIAKQKKTSKKSKK